MREHFTGYERDVETNLDYAQARYYSHTQGRFTSPDPFGGSMTVANPQSLNRYSYVNNNPVNGVDPSGMTAHAPMMSAPTSRYGMNVTGSSFTEIAEAEAEYEERLTATYAAVAEAQFLNQAQASGVLTPAEAAEIAAGNPMLSADVQPSQNSTAQQADSATLPQRTLTQYEQVIADLGRADLLRFVDGKITPHGSGSSFHVTFNFASDDQSKAEVKGILHNTKIFDSGPFGLGHKKDVGARSGKEFGDFRSRNGVLERRSLEVAINTSSFKGYADIDRYDFYGGLAPGAAHLFFEFIPDTIRGLFGKK